MEGVGEEVDGDTTTAGPSNTDKPLKESVPLAGYTKPSEREKATGDLEDTLGNNIVGILALPLF